MDFPELRDSSAEHVFSGVLRLWSFYKREMFLKGMRLLSQGETSTTQRGLFLFAHRLATASIPAEEEHLRFLTRQVPSVVYGCPMHLNV